MARLPSPQGKLRVKYQLWRLSLGCNHQQSVPSVRVRWRFLPGPRASRARRLVVIYGVKTASRSKKAATML